LFLTEIYFLKVSIFRGSTDKNLVCVSNKNHVKKLILILKKTQYIVFPHYKKVNFDVKS